MFSYQSNWIFLFFFFFTLCSFATATQSNPQKWLKNYHYLVAETHHFNQEHQRSNTYLKKTLQADHNSNYLQHRLVEFYLHQGRLYQAEKECRQILKKNNQSIPAQLLLAKIYHSLELNKKSLQYYQKVLNIQENHYFALFQSTLLKQEINGALPANTHSHLLSDYLFHQSQGNIYLSKKNIQKAIESFQKAIQLNSSDRYSAWRLFQIYNQRNKSQLFIELFKTIPQDDPYIISLVARSYLRTNQRSQAMRHLENLLLDDPLIWNLKAELIMGI